MRTYFKYCETRVFNWNIKIIHRIHKQIKINSRDKILNNEHFKKSISKVIYIKELYDKGVGMVRDLMDNNGNFISLDNIESILDKNI